jgi:hypothetical protein
MAASRLRVCSGRYANPQPCLNSRMSSARQRALNEARAMPKESCLTCIKRMQVQDGCCGSTGRTTSVRIRERPACCATPSNRAVVLCLCDRFGVFYRGAWVLHGPTSVTVRSASGIAAVVVLFVGMDPLPALTGWLHGTERKNARCGTDR